MAKTLKTAAEIAGGRRSSLAYKAIEDNQRRRSTTTKSSAESTILSPAKRERASATARDDRRNFTILAWMIRKHLDSVSRFTPFIDTGDDEVDRITMAALDWHSRKTHFDVTRRHGRDEWMRMFEACKTISGDAAGLKCQGWKLQGIEGDRLAIPTGAQPPASVSLDKFHQDGILFNPDGSRKAWCLCARGGSLSNALDFEKIVDDSEMFFDGYWPERFDSNRGVSPLLTALSEGADIRETWEWLVLKSKATALFGLAFSRVGPDPMAPTQQTLSTTPPTGRTAYAQQIQRSINARSLINLDLDPGDKVEEIESKSPNAQTVQFSRELIRVILLALDIPFTIFDSLASSFSARIADRNEYEEASEWKRDKNIDILHEIYGDWLFPLWEQADWMGLGKALKRAKMSVPELAAKLQWMPAGRPWLDRTGEMAGHILSIAAGVESIPEVCAMFGKNPYKVAAEQKRYLAKAGIPIFIAQGGQYPINEILKAATNKAPETGAPNAQPNPTP